MKVNSTNINKGTIKVKILKACKKDAFIISTILYKSFKDFKSHYTEKGFAATVPSAEEVLKRMKEGPIWIALINDKIVGHALFLPIHIQGYDGREYPCLSLGPIAVIPEFQNQGIGGQLIEVGHSTALILDFRSVVLLGHPGYYPRFGYKPAKRWNLTNPWGYTEEPWMAIELIENSLVGKGGLVVYPEAFNETT